MQPTNRITQLVDDAPQTNDASPPMPNGTNGAAAANGRDAQGRFAKGNVGGPGNPFNRQIAGFRRVLCNAVTEQDVQELAGVLLAKAKGGDLLAIKLLFQYTIGRPADAADPDRLNAQEMQFFRLNNADDDTMTDLLRGTPAELAVGLLRVLLPGRAQQLGGIIAQGLRAQSAATNEAPAKPEAAPPKPAGKDQRREKRRIPAALRKLLRPSQADDTSDWDEFLAETAFATPAPMANGRNGTAAPTPNGEGGAQAPMPNGDFGEGSPGSA